MVVGQVFNLSQKEILFGQGENLSYVLLIVPNIDTLGPFGAWLT